ncbi:MAG: hypothetical protein WC072_09730 [Methanoregulaceae archaeon]|jgi:hypothetical protein
MSNGTENRTARERIAAAYENQRMMIARVCRARIKEEKCRAEYKRAYAEAMIDDNNKGTNKEKRDAYAEVHSWKQHELWLDARSERISAEAGLECIDTHVAEMELVKDLLIHCVDPYELFAGMEEDEEC